MSKHPFIFTLCGLLLISSTAPADQSVTFTSGPQQTQLIELFTSEGCSSCPPADQFLSQFKNSDGLWRSHIPMAFHVDYWDYLGWQDRFAKAAYSNRQRTYRQQGHSQGVYTPGFVVNGKEWTGFFKAWRALPEVTNHPGILTLTVDQQQATIAFEHKPKDASFHLAVLGMGLQTKIKAGENQGHTLNHDFVVLDHQQQPGETGIDSTFATFALPLVVKHQPEQFAVVAWVSSGQQLPTIQTVGGFLPDGIIRILGDD